MTTSGAASVGAALDPTGPKQMRGVARGTTASLMGAAVMAGAQVAITLLITRTVDSTTAGVFFGCTSLFLLATTLGMLGTNTGMVYFVARGRAQQRFSDIPTYFRAGSWPVMAVACAMSVLLFLSAHSLATTIASGHADEATTYIRILAVFIPFAGLENVSLAASRGLGSMRANVMVEQLGRSLLQILFVGIAVVAAESWGLVVAWGLPYIPAALVAFLWWRRQSLAVLRRPNANAITKVDISAVTSASEERSIGREFWGFTGPRALASLAQLIIQRLDIILVLAWRGPTQAAIYAVASRFLVVGQMGNRAILLAVQPRLAQTLSRNDKESTNNFYQTATGWLMLLTWPMYITASVFAGTLLAVFGSKYSAGHTAVVILCCSMLIATLCGMVDVVLNMGGRTSWNLANVLVALGTNIGLDVWLIRTAGPYGGFVGAAIGWGVAIVLQNSLAIAQTGLILGLHPFGRASFIAGGSSLLCFGAVGITLQLVLGSPWVALICTLVVGGAAYLAILWFMRGPLRLDAFLQMRRRRVSPAPSG